VLEPYIAAGIVELADALDSTLDANGTVIDQAQLRTFAHAVRQHGADSEWMAFIDADEFLYAVGPVSVIDPFHGAFDIDEPSLPDVLLAFREFGGVVVHWFLYGSSGYIESPVGLVIDAYIWRAAAPSPMFKVVAQPGKIMRVNNHNHEYFPGFFAVDESNEMVVYNTLQKFVCVCVCVYVCIFAYVHICIYMYVCVCVCFVCVCVLVYACVCVYICMCIYICIYI
jgi:hypothetical protein